MPKKPRGSNNTSAGSTVSSSSTTLATSFDGDLHNFGNDYCDRYLKTGELPQFYIQNSTDPLVGYPKLQRLHQLKANHNAKHAGKAYGKRLSPNTVSQELNNWAVKGVNFDVVMIGGCVDDPPSYESLIALPIQRLTPRPSILFLWVPTHQLEVGRNALEHWGFRRSEDVMYFATSSNSLHFPRQHMYDAIVKSSWHCLMGLKGTLRRSDDSDLINCNVDTDLLLDTQEQRSNIIPEQMYSIIENFSLMNRRLHIVPTPTTFDKPVRPRNGWVVASPDMLLDNFAPHVYAADMHRTGGNRIPVDPEIDNLRPKTPPKIRKSK